MAFVDVDATYEWMRGMDYLDMLELLIMQAWMVLFMIDMLSMIKMVLFIIDMLSMLKMVIFMLSMFWWLGVDGTT